MPVDPSLLERDRPATAPTTVTEEGVRAFAAAIGSSYDGTVPPTWPITLAFDAMMAFLEDEQIDLHRIVHGEQRFTYERPIVVGDVLTARLRVVGLRQIGGADIIGTTSEIRDADDELVCLGRATLVHGGGA
ncbi:hypothetical protein EXE58_04870 [Nocardioides seonyuensis]|uniref:FAS1-like dehydratase domain-containing protein n=1 Tax=Nocardioides seonyuensis TaxID=2518371 RepID=A0A4P7IE96_9ACTN|nr:MaoC family dehydratase N-terminal domain-containing protein [Nocardioides seonyuensis]QBX54863.1 hypothetical protein EXE58_04870 [Nocardioides seonyuensis]